LNTFWRRALYIFGLLGSFAAVITEFILPVLIDPEVSHELKDVLRPFYGWCLGIASAAKVTTADQWLLKAKKESYKPNRYE